MKPFLQERVGCVIPGIDFMNSAAGLTTRTARRAPGGETLIMMPKQNG
jgi:phosphosulfolactate phosphohydrolase-like enzyme